MGKFKIDDSSYTEAIVKKISFQLVYFLCNKQDVSVGFRSQRKASEMWSDILFQYRERTEQNYIVKVRAIQLHYNS